MDKFRGTLSAVEACAAAADACWDAGIDAVEMPMSDGGEGLLDVLGGPNRTTRVTGPNGQSVEAAWRLDHRTAVIEMARASGLLLVGGADGNDPMLATTAGTGELIRRAADEGARHLIVGLGGSATTDGGLGALDVLGHVERWQGIQLDVAVDVRTRFVDAAPLFAPQKGASAAQVGLLRARLEQLVVRYRDEYGVDVGELEGAGAAGGLAGGLAAIGGRIISGFELVADLTELPERLVDADLVVTGEGHLDDQSLDGKVVGGVLDLAEEAGVPVSVIVGASDDDARQIVADRGATVITLVDLIGAESALSQPKTGVRGAMTAILDGL